MKSKNFKNRLTAQAIEQGALEASEARYRRLFEAAQDGIKVVIKEPFKKK